MKKAVLSVFPCVLIALGCASRQVTLADWQKSVDDYVWNQANGDPNCLRDTGWNETHKGFSVLGDPLPQEATDAHGMLLAHKPFQGRPHFVFLVAIVQRRVVRDVRIAALSAEDGRLCWTMSQADSQQTRTYSEYREKSWRARYAGRREPPPSYVAFGAADDSFDLTLWDNEIAVVHQPSGARWVLQPRQARAQAGSASR